MSAPVGFDHEIHLDGPRSHDFHVTTIRNVNSYRWPGGTWWNHTTAKHLGSEEGSKEGGTWACFIQHVFSTVDLPQ